MKKNSIKYRILLKNIVKNVYFEHFIENGMFFCVGTKQNQTPAIHIYFCIKYLLFMFVYYLLFKEKIKRAKRKKKQDFCMLFEI